MKHRKLISFDWALKRLLRSKANFEILEGFLTELLKAGGTSVKRFVSEEQSAEFHAANYDPVKYYEDLKIVEILESESNQSQEKNKFNRVDLKVRNHLGDLILIEVQYERETTGRRSAFCNGFS